MGLELNKSGNLSGKYANDSFPVVTGSMLDLGLEMAEQDLHMDALEPLILSDSLKYDCCFFPGFNGFNHV